MKTYFKITQIAYLAIAAFLIEETIRTWGDNKSRTILFIALAVMAIFMFFFKRWFQKKMERQKTH